MTNKQLLMIAATINIVMMFMLAYKQNMIIKQLYELQQLQEQKDQLLEEKKELMLTLHQQTQLSAIEDDAKKKLNLRSMNLQDVHFLHTKEPDVKVTDATN